MRRATSYKVGSHRGNARIYVSGQWLATAGFVAGAMLTASYTAGRVTLTLDDAGSRKVSVKRGRPVIDVNSAELTQALQGVETVVIRVNGEELVIEAGRVERLRAARVRNGLEGSAFSGGGMLSEAARQAGFTPAFAVEVDPDVAAVYEANHPAAAMFQCSIHEIDPDDVPQVEILTMGICCQPFSAARQGRDGLVPEAHDLGDMTFWALRLVEAANPWTVVIEEAPRYLDSGAGHLAIRALERMGYTVEARVLDSADFGALTSRKRAVIIATTDDAVTWPAPVESTRTLGDVLGADAGEWFDASTKSWLYAHWAKQKAKGNFFVSRELTADSTTVPTITKRYFAQQGSNPVVAHPTQAGTHRWLTVGEVARIMGLPAGYELPQAKTRAGAILGQGVSVDCFRAVLAAQGQA